MEYYGDLPEYNIDTEKLVIDESGVKIVKLTVEEIQRINTRVNENLMIKNKMREMAIAELKKEGRL